MSDLEARLLEDLEETEALLRLPNVEAHIDKAKRLALSIARRGPGLVSHQAMLLLSGIADQQRAQPDAASRIQSAISDLRAALGAPLKSKPSLLPQATPGLLLAENA